MTATVTKIYLYELPEHKLANFFHLQCKGNEVGKKVLETLEPLYRIPAFV